MKAVEAGDYFRGDPVDVDRGLLRVWARRAGLLLEDVNEADVLDDWADYEIGRAAHNGLQLDRAEVIEYGRDALRSLAAEVMKS